MQNEIFYLDHNATTPVHPAVIDEIARTLSEVSANPSSTHTMGRRARAILEQSREQVGQFINVPAREIIFTSGGTEADNLALMGHDWQKGDLVVSSNIEHPAVDQALLDLVQRGVMIRHLPLSQSGIVCSESILNVIKHKPKVISLLWGHNETGVIQDIESVDRLLRQQGLQDEIFFHSDAVQTIGRYQDFKIYPSMSALSISSHKINGPKGVGALWVKGGAELLQRQFGGSQEREMRPGTENLPGIVGFAKACELWQTEGDHFRSCMLKVRNEFEHRLKREIPGVYIHGETENRLVNTSCVSFPGLAADMLLLGLDMAGIQASAGSACAAGAVKSSRVIRNLGFCEEYASATIRFSFGMGNQQTDLDEIIPKIKNLVSLGGGLVTVKSS